MVLEKNRRQCYVRSTRVVAAPAQHLSLSNGWTDPTGPDRTIHAHSCVWLLFFSSLPHSSPAAAANAPPPHRNPSRDGRVCVTLTDDITPHSQDTVYRQYPHEPTSVHITLLLLLHDDCSLFPTFIAMKTMTTVYSSRRTRPKIECSIMRDFRLRSHRS